MSANRVYRIWACMKQRCYNPNASGYKYYGGRGITICDEWRYSFNSFEEWAWHNGYRQKLSIDRIDNDLGYSPENCRWATHKQQQQNRRNSHGGQGVRVTISMGDRACWAKMDLLCAHYGLCRSQMISKLIQDDMVRHQPQKAA